MLISLWLFVMSADLLYLYNAGGWYDPIRWIEISEVVLLSAIGLFSLGYFVFLFHGLLNEH